MRRRVRVRVWAGGRIPICMYIVNETGVQVWVCVAAGVCVPGTFALATLRSPSFTLTRTYIPTRSHTHTDGRALCPPGS